VVFSDAGFGLTFSLTRRAPNGKALHGGFRQAKTYLNKKAFTFDYILHFTKPINFARFSVGAIQSLSANFVCLSQTAATKYTTQVWAKCDPQFCEIGWQRKGSGTQKISGVLYRNRPGKKQKLKVQ